MGSPEPGLMELGASRRRQSFCYLPALHQSGWSHSPQGSRMVSGGQTVQLSCLAHAWGMHMVGGRNLHAVPHTQPKASGTFE